MLNSNEPIVEALRDIKAVSLSLQTSPYINNDYRFPYVGDEKNKISAEDLLAVLNNRYQIKITYDSLQRLLPELCHLFRMSYEPDDGISDIRFIKLW